MRQVSGNVKVERTRLSENTEEAVDQTVQRMAEIAFGEYGSRSPKIRAAAINIIRKAGVPEKDYYGEMLALFKWVQKNIRYVRDPVNQETLSHPEETLFNSMAGDCDDLVVLLMALLGSVGIKSHPVVVGMQPGMYSHVYLNATIPPGKHRMAGKTVPLDPIMKKWPAGREAPKSRVKARKDYKQLESMIMLNGTDDLGDIYGGMDRGSNLGAYATGPSYLDNEYSGAEDLLVTTAHTPDITHDLVLSNTPKAVQSPEGMDGMMGLGFELMQTMPAGFESLDARGPMVSWKAKQAHRGLTAGGKYIRKRYEGGEMESRLRQARGQRVVNGTSPNRKVVVVNDGKKEITPDNAPLTPQEQSDELDGLYGMIGEMRQRVMLAGLGAEDDPGTAEDAKKGATLSWFAQFKARMAAARAGWLEEKAKHEAIKGDTAKAKELRERAQTQKKLAAKAIEVAKEGVGLEKAMEKASPKARGVIAARKAALEEAEQDEPMAAEADEKPAAPSKSAGIPRGTSWGQRRSALMRSRAKRLEQKAEALDQNAKKVERKRAAKVAAAARKQEKIEAPIKQLEVSDPAKRGRRNALRRTGGFPAGSSGAPANEATPREGVVVPQQWEATDPDVNKRATEVPSGISGLPTINTPIAALNSPIVQYGALALGAYFLLKKR